MSASLEVIVAVAVATGCIAALQSAAPAADLGVLYLLAVLAIAIRRGQLAALATAVLGMLTLNYLFITPRHRLTIAHSQDLVALAVLMIAASSSAAWPQSAASGRRRPRSEPGWQPRASARRRCWPRPRPRSSPGRASPPSSRASAAAWPAPPGEPSAGGPRTGAVAGRRRDRAAAARSQPAPPGCMSRLTPRGRSGRPGADLRAARPADRRRRRARARRRARGRDRGRPPGRGRPDRDPPRDLARPALAADRDHHRRLGAARRRRHRGRARPS